MYVLKRNGKKQEVHFDKISQRLKKLCGSDLKDVDPIEVAQQVCHGLHPGIKTSDLDILAAEIAAGKCTKHPSYGTFAGRILMSNLHKTTNPRYSEVAKLLHSMDLFSQPCFDFVMKHREVLDKAIITANDYSYDYFAFKTLEKSYLLRHRDVSRGVIERPQYLLMRVAVGLQQPDLAKVLETYRLLSDKWFTCATPTLYNSGSKNPQMSSCFLLTMKSDSISGIFDTVKQCAEISKCAGGIGLSVSNIRASGSYISGTNGRSNGLVPMLRVLNSTSAYVDQGGGRRKGSFAIYLEPWHADIEAFLELRLNQGAEELRARDLFYALWIPDLFMKRVEQGGKWSLFCPNEAPGLQDVWGKEFDALYCKHEASGKARKVMDARKLFDAIVKTQIETGMPFILFKDACNAKSNQKNLGTIRSSNLCTEIVEYCSADEIAVCNLASLSLKRFVNTINGTFDHQKLREVTQVVTRNLNRIIDLNHYPVEECKRSNLRHRPIGLGVQGLADCFHELRIAYDGPEARKLNREIFETMYFAALEASCDLAKLEGVYSTYEKSPMSQGLLQMDMWPQHQVKYSGRWDWSKLRGDIAQYGVRNSLLIAPMPTASTSQILGNNECFEPYTLNIYVRRTLAGEFVCICHYLVQELTELGLWSSELKQKIVAAKGSVQSIPEIPVDIKARYKTVFEIPGKHLIDMAADRAPFIDQSQSFNCYMGTPTEEKVRSMHFYAWRQGLKGTYYLRTFAAVDPIQFTVPSSVTQQNQNQNAPVCTRKSREEHCTSCSG